MGEGTGPAEAGGPLFRLALLGACILVLSSLLAVGFSLVGGHSLATGRPLARLDSPQLLAVSGVLGSYDPTLLVSDSGALQALVSERGGSCVEFGAGLQQASRVVASGPADDPPAGLRSAPYCAAAMLPSGALAFAAISPAGGRVVGTLDSSGTFRNGAPLSGPAIVFGAMWLTATPSGVYLAAETQDSSGDCCAVTVWHSSDGLSYGRGATVPQPANEPADPATFFGAISVDPQTTAAGWEQERLYLPFSHAGAGNASERELWLARSDDGGSRWTDEPVAATAPGTTVAAQYPATAVDAGGAVYVAWSDTVRVWYAWSKDRGQTIGGLQRVDAQLHLNVMPAIVAGDAGHVAVAWYAGTGGAVMGASSQDDEWRPELAVTGNADSTKPALVSVTLSGSTVHHGSICLLGDGCADSGDGGSYDPRLGVHLALALDPVSGGLAIAYAADGAGRGEPAVRMVRLRCGERLLVRPPQPLPSCG